MQTSRTSFAGATSSNRILFVAGCPLMAPYDKGVIYLAMVTSRSHAHLPRITRMCHLENATFVLAGCPLMAVCDFRSTLCDNVSLLISGCPLMAVCDFRRTRCGNISLLIAGCQLMAVRDFRSTRCGNVWLLMDFVFPLVADSPAQA